MATIGYHEKNECISFSNGRHRTTLLSQYIDAIPFAVFDEFSRNPMFQAAIIGPVKPTDKLTLPDFEILDILALRSDY